MKACIATCFCFLVLGGASAAPFPSASQIIQKEGKLAFNDASSFYVLEKDGSFYSGPLGESGRLIHGRWTNQNNVFVVEGRWIWMNGVSSRNDYRKMTMRIIPEAIETRQVSRDEMGIEEAYVGTPKRIYKCRIVIAKVVKVSKPK